MAKLTENERQRLAALLSEAKSRGLESKLRDLHLVESKNKHKFFTDTNGYFIRRDGRNYCPTNTQKLFLLSNARFALARGSRGSGKALSVDTPIPTKDGWKLMGDISEGDVVFDELGNQVQVINISDIMYGHRCYKVTFSDESEIIADANHLWTVMTDKSRHINSKHKELPLEYSVLTTEEMIPTLYAFDKGDLNYSIDCCSPIVCDESDLPIPPYTFGAWLGDGTELNGRITLGKTKTEILNWIRAEGVKVYDSYKDTYRLDFVDNPNKRDSLGRYSGNSNSFYSQLRELNVLGNKHIPQIYLRSSIEQRMWLLRGLLDTDGYIDKKSACEYCTCDKGLADTFYELMVSLGYKIVKKSNFVYINGKTLIRYRFSFVSHGTEFMLTRKRSRILSSGKQFLRTKRRYIVSIEPVDSVPVKCIQVNSKSSLYLVGKSFIPTHNSALGAQKALKKLSEGNSGTIANPRFEDLKKSTWVEFREWIPWDNVIPRHKYMSDIGWSPHQPFQVAFNNGAIAYLQGFNSPDTARGANVNWLWYDEAGSDEDGMAWKIAIASVRVGKDPQAWITTTPKGKLHWIYDFFIKKEIPEKLIEMIEKIGDGRPIIEHYYLSIDDNIDNLDPGIVTALMTAYVEGSSLYKQEVLGEFVVEGGSRGSSSWFNYHMLDNSLEVVKKRIRYWDFAATEKHITGKKKNDPDKTCSTLMAWDGELKFVIENQVSGFWEWADIKDEVVKIAKLDGPYVTIYIEQEGGSGGKNQVAAIKEYVQEQLGSQWKVEGHRPEGDKVQRADIWFAEASRGQMYCVRGSWNTEFFDQLDNFPEAKHDDTIDSVSGARICIAPINKIWKSIEFIHL